MSCAWWAVQTHFGKWAHHEEAQRIDRADGEEQPLKGSRTCEQYIPRPIDIALCCGVGILPG